MKELILELEYKLLNGLIDHMDAESLLNDNGIETEWTDNPNVTIYQWEGGEYTSTIE